MQAEEQEQAPELKLVETVDVDRVVLNSDDIRYLWAAKILNDTAYIALALQVNKQQYKTMQKLDYQVFSERWAYEGDKNIKPKYLTVKQIRDAIHKLEEADFINAAQQLSLELNY